MSQSDHAADVLTGIQHSLTDALAELEEVLPDIPARNQTPAIHLDGALRTARTRARNLSRALRSAPGDHLPPPA